MNVMWFLLGFTIANSLQVAVGIYAGRKHYARGCAEGGGSVIDGTCIRRGAK